MIDDDDINNNEEDVTLEIKTDVQRAIAEAFSLFTTKGKNDIISVSDVGKIIRYLGCVPSEDELNEFVNSVIDKEYPQTVSLNVFLPHLEKQILAFRYIPGTADELLRAFKTLDAKGEGSLSADLVRRALAEGESFDQDEINDAIRSVYDPDHETIHYDVWIHKLLGKTKMNVYALIPVDDSAKRAAEKEDELNRLLL